MESSLLVESYTRKSNPISNTTKVATVEKTSKVQSLAKPAPPPPGDAIPLSHFAPAGVGRTFLTRLPEQSALRLL